MRDVFNKILDKAFEIGILIKSFFGVFEILAGVVFAVTGRLVVNNFIIALTQEEIVHDSQDFLANFLINATSDLTTGTYLFAVIYLITHGVVNLFLAIALMKGKLWAYLWAVVGFGIFIIYQTFRYFHTYSLLLLVLTVFDLLIVTIILLEYKKRK